MTQIGRAIRQTRQSVQNVTMCNWSLKHTAISLSSCEAEFYAAHCLRRENCWDSQNASRNFTTTFEFVSRWIQTRQDTVYSAGDQADSNTLKYDAWQYNSGYARKRLSVRSSGHEELHCRSLHETSDGLRTQSLAKKLGLRILGGTNGTNGDE